MEIEIILSGISMIFLGLTFGNVELNIMNPSSKKLNRKWHWFKAFFQGFIYSAVSYSIYGLSWKAILFIILLLALTVLIFNPVINKVRNRKDFFYISKEGIEGFFYTTPKLYYFLNVILVILIYFILK